MKILPLITAMLAFMLGILPHASGQQLSNMGKDFWIGYGHHVRMYNSVATPEKMQLYITGEMATTGKVTIPGIGFEKTYQVAPRKITTVDIPRTAALLGDGLYNLGIHVTAESPVVVYSFIYVSAVSGATLCLPTNTLGRDYYSINFDQLSNEANCSSYFFVVAADTGVTSVEITPAAATRSGKVANQPFLVQLEQGQVYQVLGATSGHTGVDLTGSRIRSVNTGAGCKKIAVFSGSSKISIGCTSPATSDNLYQQAYPTATWSRKYIAVPSAANSRNFFRVIRPDPGTTVKVNNQVVPASAFTRNFYYQFSGNQPFVIEADKPIMVAQYFPSEGCSGNSGPGDPEMIFLNPVDQNLKEVSLNAMQPSGVNIRQHFLNVVLPNTPAAINSFKLDGNAYGSFQPLAADNSFAYAQITTSKGTHQLSCDSGFNVISYGFGSAESYGYSGGTRLRDLYQFPTIANQFARLDSVVTCAGAPFRLAMTFPFLPARIQWRFGGLLPDVVLNMPVPDSVYLSNGKMLYRVTMPSPIQVPVAGNYPVSILVSSNIGDGCTTELELEHELKVYPRSRAFFSTETKGCTNDTVFLKEAFTTSNTLLPKTWLWQLNNKDTLLNGNPTIHLNAPGRYAIEMAVVNELGCISDTAIQWVNIHPRPEPAFSAQGPFCVGRKVNFQNHTQISSGKLAAFTWKFSDGAQLQTGAAQNQQHQFQLPGTYRVQLEAWSDQGCAGTAATQVIHVTNMPKAGFTAPFTCIADPHTQFSNCSKIAGGDTTLTFRWQFGDQTVSDTIRHPSHRFKAPGDYQVFLTATSAGGCMDTAVQTITVSGDQPRASFELLNGNNQCSDTAIVLRNNSTVNGGSLYQMEIAWDYDGDQSLTEKISMPVNGGLFHFKPPSFFLPENKTYKVRMSVRSGQHCQSTTEQVVTVHALPQLRFDSLPLFCSGDKAYIIREVELINHVPGSGAFSGPGVSPDGVFLPARARIGNNTLHYHFESSAGCRSFTSQKATVLRSPSVNAGPDMVVRQGSSLQIQATSSSSALTYHWHPSAGLSDSSKLQPVASPLKDQTYTVTATTHQGCTAKDEVTIVAPTALFIPSSFTPNNDGVNDCWRIPYLMKGERFSLKVYNRDGFCVYESNGGGVWWDGRYKGVIQNSGTFVYVLVLNATGSVYKGTVTLIR